MKKLAIMMAVIAAAAASAQKLYFPMGIHVSEDSTRIPTEARAYVENKLTQLTSANGMGAWNASPQFISVSVMPSVKEVLGTAPAKVVTKFETTLYCADATTGHIYATATLNLNGVGENEQKAFISAFRSLTPANAQVKSFLTQASVNVIAHYEQLSESLITVALKESQAGKYELALYHLACIPEACSTYPKVLKTAVNIYGEYLDEMNYKTLQKAKALWAASQNEEGAIAVAELLAEIPHNSKYSKQADALLQQVSKYIKGERDWEKKRVLAEERLQEKTVDAWRQIGVAYGNHQQPVTYRSVL